MPFNTAISGLSAANKDLNVVGNNIANANTIGFKSSRAEFSDIYQSSLNGEALLNNVGSGVKTDKVNQLFTQGNISATGNNLDLTIDGKGFFILDDGGKTQYTRAGIFGLDSSSALVANSGAKIQGYSASNAGVLSTNISDLTLHQSALQPRQTTEIILAANLDSSSITPPDVSSFDAENPNSYNYSASTNILDSLGNSHSLVSYFSKTSTANQWKLYAKVDGLDVGDPVAKAGLPTLASYNILFNSDGTIDTKNSDLAQISYWNPVDATGKDNGALKGSPGENFPNVEPFAHSNFSIDLSKLTQTASDFSIVNNQQNGFPSGQLQNLEVSQDGIISGQYSNGQSRVLGQLALAKFSNEQGLRSVGNTAWISTLESGDAIVGVANSEGMGALHSGSLESSNVDLSNELISLIVAQRNFQANAKTIQAEDEVAQAIINAH